MTDIGSKYVKCPDCESLYVASPDKAMHQKDCPHAAEGDDADKMRQLADKIVIGSWSDEVLALKPHQVRKPEIIGKRTDGIPGYVINWVYPGVTFTMARGIGQFRGGQLSVYAVQRMQFNTEVEKTYGHAKPKKQRKSAPNYR